MGKARIEWQDEFIEIDDTDNPDIGQLESAMRFKAQHIKAKADPQLFECVADTLNSLTECIFKGAYLKHGHWVDRQPEIGLYGCNLCGHITLSGEEPYCAKCGARMDEPIETK